MLAAASHDLRQPLQTLALIHGLLAQTVQGERARSLLARFEAALGAMSGALTTLLDLAQPEGGARRAEMELFPVDVVLDRLRDEVAYHVEARGLAFHVVPCSLQIRSDPRLLGRMIRILLSAAMNHTRHGKILLGCRRQAGMLRIEIWTTGGLRPEADLLAIGAPQPATAESDVSRGLGLGLPLVQRLADELGHRLRVRSGPGKGPVFAVEVVRTPAGAAPGPEQPWRDADGAPGDVARHSGTILVIEDDPDVGDLLGLLLRDAGHVVARAPDGGAALDLVSRGTVRPDLILVECRLPNGMDGVPVVAMLRHHLHRQIPAIVLTGDLSAGAQRDIAGADCVPLDKPVKARELTRTIRRLLPPPPAAAHPGAGARSGSPGAPVIFVVDDDSHVRAGLRGLLEAHAKRVEDYASGEAFLSAYRPGSDGFLLVDAYLPGMSGIQVLQRLREAGDRLPTIVITGNSDVRMAVQAMKAGALDFIEKPVGSDDLLASVARAQGQVRDSSQLTAWREAAASCVAGLTPRQRQIMALVLAGLPSKNIAADLGISRRTVENHRAAIMKRTGTRSLPALARLALAAVGAGKAVG